MDHAKLSEASRLIQQGQKAKAIPILLEFVKEHPTNSRAWLLLGYSLDDLHRKEKCYKRVLALDPDNQKAHDLLSSLTRSRQVEPASAPSSAPGRPRGGQRRSSSIPLVLGLVAGLLGVALPLLYASVTAPPPDFIVDLARSSHGVVVLTLSPTPESATATQSPTALNTSTATATALRLLDAAPTWTLTPPPAADSTRGKYDRMRDLLAKYFLEEGITDPEDLYTLADQMIDLNPEFGLAYLLRAKALFLVQDYGSNSALEPVPLSAIENDLGIALDKGPVTGEVYALRYRLWGEYLVKGDYYYYKYRHSELRMQDLIMSIHMGQALPGDGLLISSLLTHLGRCQESVNYLLEYRRQYPEIGEYGSYSSELALAYLCLEEFPKAIDSIQIACELCDIYDFQVWQAIILYESENYVEAAALLEELLAYNPYDATLYTVRAGVRVAEGDYYGAHDDLDLADWLDFQNQGYRNYIRGELAYREGSMDQAGRYFQEAEAILSPWHNSIKLKALERLQELGLERLYPDPVPNLEIEVPSPSALIARLTPPEAPDPAFNANPTVFTYAGTGWQYLVQDSYIAFKPAGPYTVEDVGSLWLVFDGFELEEYVNAKQIEITLYSPDGEETFTHNDLTFGRFKVPNPERFVAEDGTIYLYWKYEVPDQILLSNISIVVEGTDSFGFWVIISE